MNWDAYIDIYCERLAPGLWGEPLNAVTNAAFLVAALAAFARNRGLTAGQGAWPVLALTSLVAVIGVGSFLFHTFATYWALLADIIPISIFIYAYLGFALRRFIGAGWPVTLAVVAGFVAASSVLDSLVPARFLYGSAGYLPAVAALVATGAVLQARGHGAGRVLLAGGGLLAVSLTLRTLDTPLCGLFPSGTHFLWHMLNATLLYILLRAAALFGMARN